MCARAGGKGAALAMVDAAQVVPRATASCVRAAPATAVCVQGETREDMVTLRSVSCEMSHESRVCGTWPPRLLRQARLAASGLAVRIACVLSTV